MIFIKILHLLFISIYTSSKLFIKPDYEIMNDFELRECTIVQSDIDLSL